MNLKWVQTHSCVADGQHFRTDLEGARLFGVKIGEDLNKGFIVVSLIFIFWIFWDNLTELDRKKMVNKD